MTNLSSAISKYPSMIRPDYSRLLLHLISLVRSCQPWDALLYYIYIRKCIWSPFIVGTQLICTHKVHSCVVTQTIHACRRAHFRLSHNLRSSRQALFFFRSLVLFIFMETSHSYFNFALCAHFPWSVFIRRGDNKGTLLSSSQLDPRVVWEEWTCSGAHTIPSARHIPGSPSYLITQTFYCPSACYYFSLWHMCMDFTNHTFHHVPCVGFLKKYIHGKERELSKV